MRENLWYYGKVEVMQQEILLECSKIIKINVAYI